MILPYVIRVHCSNCGRTQRNEDDRCTRCGRPVHIEEKEVD